MTDPFASEGNGELGANPNPNAAAPTPGDDQAMHDPQPTADQPDAGQPGTAQAHEQQPNDVQANEIQGRPSESTESPWSVPGPDGASGTAAQAVGVTEPTVPIDPAQPATGAVAEGAPGIPHGAPTMPPPGAPAGQTPFGAVSGAPFGVQPGMAADTTAFGQAPVTPAGGWPGSQAPGFPHAGPQAMSGQANGGMPPGMPPQGAYPMGAGAVPPGAVPPGAVPPGHFPPGQYPPGGPGGMPPVGQPKPYSPLPWIILAVVLALGLLIVMAFSFFAVTATEQLIGPAIDTSEDTVSEFSEFAPDGDETDEPTLPSDLASKIASLPTQETLPPAPVIPATPGAPEPAPATGNVPFTVPDPAQIQGDTYNDFNSPAGITAIDPMDIAVGETKEGKVGPAQMVPVKINLKAGQKVTIAVKGELFADYRFWVTSPANELVAFGDDSVDTETKGQTLDPRIEFVANADGVHTILVNNSFSVAESAFNITVNE